MTRKARRITVAIGVIIVFVLVFATAGYFIGVRLDNGTEVYGWDAAIIVGLIATGGTIVIAALGALLAALLLWAEKGQ